MTPHTHLLPNQRVWLRVADPGWEDPLDARWAGRTGGRWNPPGSHPTLYLNADLETARLQILRLREGTPVDIETSRTTRTSSWRPPFPGIRSAPSPLRPWNSGRSDSPETTRPTEGAGESPGRPVRRLVWRSSASDSGACSSARPSTRMVGEPSSPGSRRRPARGPTRSGNSRER